MQTQMAREEELFRLSDVIAAIHAKIKRRHPHVWGDWQVEHSEEVVANWEAIKVREKEGRRRRLPRLSLTTFPAALPALARSQKIQERVRKVGFDWPALEGVIAKLHEEIAELVRRADEAQRAELGDLLFAAVNWARWLGIDAEGALREANLRFGAAFANWSCWLLHAAFARGRGY
jgi:MazG family protein